MKTFNTSSTGVWTLHPTPESKEFDQIKEMKINTHIINGDDA